MLSTNTVLVVGGGPVGLLTAFRLRQRGLGCTVVEQHPWSHSRSRASTFHPAVLDRLADLGLAEPLLAAGVRVDRIRSWDLASGCQHDLDFRALAAETAHPFRLHLEQSEFRRVLLQRLSQPGDTPIRLIEQHRVEALECNDMREGVRLRLQPLNGQKDSVTLSGRWLVVADGAKSTLRPQLGLSLDGSDLPEPVVRLTVPALPEVITRELAGITYVRKGERSLSVLQMPDGWRLILRASIEERSRALADHQWTLEVLGALFAQHLEPDWWLTTPLHWDYYHVAQRCVPERHIGGALVIGDAAHVTNTRGGLNMNFGLLEGLALAEALAPESGMAPSAQRIDDWARLWQQHCHTVLLARTSRLLGGGTPLEGFGPATPSAIQSSGSVADLQRIKLRQASLLDLNLPA